jgi:hypothetical protein
MPLFRMVVEKRLGTEFWSNRYIIQMAAINAVNADLAQIILCERSACTPEVEITKYGLSDLIPDNDTFMVVPVGLQGLRSGALATMLPLFNVARVDFTVEMGSPSRKYYRGLLVEGDIENAGSLTDAFIDYVNENIAAPLAALDSFVDVDGQPFTGGACSAFVGMRQLRKGTRRRTTSII